MKLEVDLLGSKTYERFKRVISGEVMYTTIDGKNSIWFEDGELQSNPLIEGCVYKAIEQSSVAWWECKNEWWEDISYPALVVQNDGDLRVVLGYSDKGFELFSGKLSPFCMFTGVVDNESTIKLLQGN